MKKDRTEEEFRALLSARQRKEAARIAEEEAHQNRVLEFLGRYAGRMGEDKVISQAEAARMLGLSRARVTQLIDAGVLPYVERTVTERAVRETDVVRLMNKERRPGRPRKPEGAPDGANQ